MNSKDIILDDLLYAIFFNISKTANSIFLEKDPATHNPVNYIYFLSLNSVIILLLFHNHLIYLEISWLKSCYDLFLSVFIINSIIQFELISF